jgi:predicted secreted protein
MKIALPSALPLLSSPVRTAGSTGYSPVGFSGPEQDVFVPSQVLFEGKKKKARKAAEKAKKEAEKQQAQAAQSSPTPAPTPTTSSTTASSSHSAEKVPEPEKSEYLELSSYLNGCAPVII